MSGDAKWQKCEFSNPTNLALSGIKVLDLSRLVAGNMASLQLADFGASVTKIEPLPHGDPLRNWKQAGFASFWKVYGRNKRSLALDFHHIEAIPTLKRLIAKADVLIESFRPGTLELMKLVPMDLLESNPRLIVLRISGFGQTGPYSKRPGFGTLAEGMSGFAHRNGEQSGGPLLPPLALADMIAGLYGSNAVLMALRVRDSASTSANQSQGAGQIIDLSLLEAMVSVMGPEALDYSLVGKPKPRTGNASNLTCPRNVYLTRDGFYIALSASIQKTAEKLFHSIGRADMIDDPRYATNESRVRHRAEVDKIIGAWIASKSRSEALKKFEDDGITAAPLYDIRDICEDEHFIQRGVYVDTPDVDLGTTSMHAPVPRLSSTPGSIRRPAPTLGQHTIDLLTESEFSSSEVHKLLSTGVVAESELK